ncbi:glycosyltransferase [Dactylosporangium sp. NBC_01737]|uniref:glycosyltransferase n=1 Tax=Dactylosporangium sp. NBC_01737 TaxID=2975959 RepID=UPI002E132B84|nr:glycosyltransferase [Dactylosporangium sp. NBC_01737]
MSTCPSPHLLAISASRFPQGEATANRLFHLARSVCHAGGRVTVANDATALPSDGSSGTVAAGTPDTAGLAVVTLGGPVPSRVRRLLLRSTRPVRVLVALRRAGVRPGDLTATLVPLALLTVGLWAALRIALRCPVTVDVTERHDPHQFRRGRWDPRFLRHRWAEALTGWLADGVVVPSSALERRFAARRVPVLRVPPLVDCAAFPSPQPPSLGTGLRLLYAGTPGAKDLLDVVVAAVAAEPGPVRLVVAGLDASDAIGGSDLRTGTLAAAGERVEFAGRMPHRRVLELLAASHCSVLVRPPGGYADAGYPSKVPEALAAGCPMLANLTSDLADTLQDGRNSVVVAGIRTEDVAAAIGRALTLTDAQWRELSAAAVAAADRFDYRRWDEPVTAFLTDPRSPAAPRPATTREHA